MNKELPILFSTDMVYSILEGRKSVTRRLSGLELVNFTPDDWYVSEPIISHPEALSFEFVNKHREQTIRITPRILPHTILYVRETWVKGYGWDGDKEISTETIFYKASEDWQKFEWYNLKPQEPTNEPKWKPGIHLLKESSRIWLQVESVNVGRLQDITEEQAISEGIQYYDDDILGRRYKDYLDDPRGYGDPKIDFPTLPTAKESFLSLWQKINQPENPNDNPWTWAISFKVLSTTGRPEIIT